MTRRVLTLVPLAALTLAAADWGPMQFLIGHWTGEGHGPPGVGAGSFSWSADLQGKVLVRKSFAEYPAANGKPAYRHDDRMVVYREDGQLRALYLDNEDHVIHYAVEPVEGGVAFISEKSPGAPAFRLTYTSTGKDSLKLKFEIAPPGRDFAVYLEGAAHRDKP